MFFHELSQATGADAPRSNGSATALAVGS